MTRSVPEWKGAIHNSTIPERIKLRIWGRCGGRCAECTRKCGIGGEPFQFDHTVALVNGGSHIESNLRLMCVECHKRKTADDLAEKAKSARVYKKHVGIRKRSQFACSRSSPWRKKLNGEVVER